MPAEHKEHFFLPMLFEGFVQDDAGSTDSYLDLPPDDMDKVGPFDLNLRMN